MNLSTAFVAFVLKPRGWPSCRLLPSHAIRTGVIFTLYACFSASAGAINISSQKSGTAITPDGSSTDQLSQELWLRSETGESINISEVTYHEVSMAGSDLGVVYDKVILNAPGFKSPTATSVLSTRPVFDATGPLTMAAISDAVYTMAHVPGWELIQPFRGNSGLQAALYMRNSDGRCVLAFAGTTLSLNKRNAHDSVLDLHTDLGIASQIYAQPAQFDIAESIAKSLVERYGKNLLVTGHSLGGALAQDVAAHYGLRSIVFNTAPMGQVTKLRLTQEQYNWISLTGIVITNNCDIVSQSANAFGDKTDLKALYKMLFPVAPRFAGTEIQFWDKTQRVYNFESHGMRRLGDTMVEQSEKILKYTTTNEALEDAQTWYQYVGARGNFSVDDKDFLLGRWKTKVVTVMFTMELHWHFREDKAGSLTIVVSPLIGPTEKDSHSFTWSYAQPNLILTDANGDESKFEILGTLDARDAIRYRGVREDTSSDDTDSTDRTRRNKGFARGVAELLLSDFWNEMMMERE